jgi:uncharacterized protein (DUF2141 family)
LSQIVLCAAMLLLAAFVLFPPQIAKAEVLSSGAPITIAVKGLVSSEGVVRVEVCTSDTFLTANCPFSATAAAVKGETIVTIHGVPPGSYAVQLFHDQNNNGRLDMSALGFPREAYGFSNDAPVGLRGPKFSQAAFVHRTEQQALTVSLRRFGS